MTFAPRSSVALLVGVSLLSGLALLLAGWVEYGVRLWNVRISFRHEDHCVQRILRAMSRYAAFPLALGGLSDPERELQRATTMHCRLIGRALRQSLNIPPALVQLILATGLMLYLHWLLTIVLGGVMLLSLRVLTAINKRGMDAMADLDTALRGAQKQRQGLYRDFLDVRPARGVVRQQIRELPDHPAHRRSVERRRAQVIVTDNSKVLSETMTALAFVLIIVFFGFRAIQESAHWGALIGFVLAARWALNALKQLTGAVTSVNRFMPAVHGYRTVLGLLKQHHRRRRSAQSSPVDSQRGTASLILRPSATPITDDSSDTFELSRSAASVIASAEPLDAFTLIRQMATFDLGDRVIETLLHDVYIVPGRSQPTDRLSLRQITHLADADRDALIAELTAAGVEDAEHQVPASLDDPASLVWTGWPVQMRLGCLVVAARRSGASLVVFSQEASARLAPEKLQRFRDFLDRKLVLIATYPQQLMALDGLGVDQIAVIDGEHVWGIGDWAWVHRHRETIEAFRSDTTPISERDDAENEIEIIMGG